MIYTQIKATKQNVYAGSCLISTFIFRDCFWKSRKKQLVNMLQRKITGVTVFRELLTKRWGYILINMPRLSPCRGRVQSVPIR
jgi:hypothetical protein